MIFLRRRIEKMNMVKRSDTKGHVTCRIDAASSCFRLSALIHAASSSINCRLTARTWYDLLRRPRLQMLGFSDYGCRTTGSRPSLSARLANCRSKVTSSPAVWLNASTQASLNGSP